MAIAFRNHSHSVCIFELKLSDSAYPKEELKKRDVDPALGKDIVLQRDDRFKLNFYKLKYKKRLCFNYSIQPQDVVLTLRDGSRYPKELPLEANVKNLKYAISILLNEYLKATRKRYGECGFAFDGSCFDVALGGYPLV